MKKPKIMITDGGVEANVTCVCGKKFKISVWGLRYVRTKKGEIIKPRKHTKDSMKCKCGRDYIFVAIPDVFYKILNEDDFKKVPKSKEAI
jgi:hypothetical protein